MYVYDEYDQRIIEERVAQFRDQTRRFLAGELGEEEFRPLRLQNGLYVQRHAPMLRVCVPYGLLSAAQLRMLGKLARDYDKSYAHISTRQNVQYNWPALENVPDVVDTLTPGSFAQQLVTVNDGVLASLQTAFGVGAILEIDGEYGLIDFGRATKLRERLSNLRRVRKIA